MFLFTGTDFVIILTLFVIVFSIFAVIIAMVTMKRNRRRYEESMEKNTRGEVMNIILRSRYTNVTGMNTDPDLAGWRYRKGNYLIQFLRDDGVFMLLDSEEKTQKNIHVGYYGDITYKANVLLEFKRRKKHEEERRRLQEEEPLFFKNKGTQGKTVGFYVEAPSFKLNIPAEQMMQCDRYEVKNYADRMFQNTKENFFGLDDGQQVIQFFHQGKGEQVSIDIPAEGGNGSYQTEIDGMYDLLHIIDLFFEGGNIMEAYHFELMEIK